jgi:hypothetical protein
MPTGTPVKPRLLAAVGLVIAIGSGAGARMGGVVVGSYVDSASGQDDSQSFRLRVLPIAAAPAIDRLKLVEASGQVTLLYSTQERGEPSPYELVIHAAPIADVARVSEVARIPRMLGVAPQWDALPVGDRYEILYEVAGGAINDIHFQDAQGNTTRVSLEHSHESFTRPHFVRQSADAGTADVGAVADRKKVVVFPGGTKQTVKYVALTDGDDGVVGRATEHWVAAKNLMSGDTLFNTLPGRLTLSFVVPAAVRSTSVPDLLVYEFDAAAIANDVLVFATSKPALLILASRPHRPFRLSTEIQRSLSQLSRPTVLVTSQLVHLAAIVSVRSDQAVVVYGTVPVDALRP